MTTRPDASPPRVESPPSPTLAAREPRELFTGLLLAAGGAIAFSGKAIIAKLSYRYGVDAVTTVMYRMLFAMPLFVALSWWSGRGKPPLTARDWLWLFGLCILAFSGEWLARRRLGLR